VWANTARPGLRILPDGCIDIVAIGDDVLTVAGPDTHANIAGLPEGTPTATELIEVRNVQDAG
jgi:hypothetical protein